MLPARKRVFQFDGQPVMQAMCLPGDQKALGGVESSEFLGSHADVRLAGRATRPGNRASRENEVWIVRQSRLRAVDQCVLSDPTGPDYKEENAAVRHGLIRRRPGQYQPRAPTA
jgi:hypothetical protein